MHKSHGSNYSTPVEFNLFEKNCHHFAFEAFMDSHQFNLRLKGYSTAITIFVISRLKKT